MIIPHSFHGIVEEVHRFTGLPKDEIEYRTWMEALHPGWNVTQDVARFGVTPYFYDEKMTKLYTEGDCFIIDCLVFWSKPSRQRWIQQAVDRINHYCSKTKLPAQEIRILMLGDGPGNDSLYLANLGFKLDYFDVPGSKTYAFALDRFKHYAFLDHLIQPIPSYEQCLSGKYDVVLSFEVLEHLSDPAQSIRQIGQMLKPGGIALITEDFGNTPDYLPTHLKSNDHLLGKAPYLFMKNSMCLSWYSQDPLFKPYEFLKQERVSIKDWLQVFQDNKLRGRFLYAYSRKIVSLINRAIYIGG